MITSRGEGNRELVRWAACGTAVLAVHLCGAGVLALSLGSELPGGAAAVAIELSTLPVAPSSEQRDVAIAAKEELHDPEPEKVELKEQPVPIEKLPETSPSEAEIPFPKIEEPATQPKRKDSASLTTAPSPADQNSERLAVPNVGAASNPAVRANWQSSISAHLNRFKKYPDEARGRKGRPVISFTIDRSGHVLSSSLAYGSGISILDQEAVNLARRAAPFPPAPADVPGSIFAFRVPVEFY